jgi:P27 family predicted phage terminase small subunit
MTASKRLPAPPKHLSSEARSLWVAVVAGYELEPRHEKTLLVALESLDRLRQAPRAIEADGPYPADRFGQPKAHPALAIERDSRIAYLRAMREMGLDLSEPISSRPPSRWHDR